MNALEVSGLKKSYGDFSLDVSFALEQGKITGFIGRNGAGKTTTINLCSASFIPMRARFVSFQCLSPKTR